MKAIQTVRTHPKKIIFFSSLLGLGARWAYHHNEDAVLRKRMCEQILPVGRQPFRLNLAANVQSQNTSTSPPRIVVVLNERAGKSKAAAQYKENCEPLLHLTGSAVSLVQDEGVQQLRTCCAVLDHNDADHVLIAGGDGTLHHAVNAILGRTADQQKAGRSLPIAFLPLGIHSVAFSRFRDAASVPPHSDEQQRSDGLKFAPRQAYLSDCYEAVRMCINDRSRKLNVMQVETVGEASTVASESESDKQTFALPTYAVATLKFGRFITAENNADRFWLLGPMRYGGALIKERLRKGASINTRTVRVRFVRRCDADCESCKRVMLERKQQSLVVSQNTKPQSKSFVSRLFSSGNAKLGSLPNRQDETVFSGYLECPNRQETTLDAVSVDDLSVRFVGDSLSLTLGEAASNVFAFIRNGIRSRKWNFDTSPFRTYENLNELEIEFTEAESDQAGEDKQSEKITVFIDGEKYQLAERALRIKLMRNLIDVCAPAQ